MSPASTAAAALQRPLLLHLPRPHSCLPKACFRNACAAFRPLLPPELRFLNWLECRQQQRSSPSGSLRRQQLRIFSAAGAGVGGRKSGRPGNQQEHCAEAGEAGGASGDTEQVPILPRKRGRGRPKKVTFLDQAAENATAKVNHVPPHQNVFQGALAGSVSGKEALVAPSQRVKPGVKSRVSGSFHSASSSVPQPAAAKASVVENYSSSKGPARGPPERRLTFSPTVPVRKVSSKADVVETRGSRISTLVTKEEGKGKMASGRRGGRSQPTRLPSSHVTSTISFLQILGTGMDTEDTAPSVLLFFDKRRFIFNAGEGLQRFCMEHKIKLSKIDHLFLTRVNSETANGIPGLLLTLGNINESKSPMNIWGTTELQYFVNAMQTFIPNAAFVHTKSFGRQDIKAKSDGNAGKLIDVFNDEFVKVSAVLLHPSSAAFSGKQRNVEALSSDQDAPTENEPRGQKRPFNGIPTRGHFADEYRGGDVSVVYVCELPQVRGKFDPVKAQALGVRPGRKYSELQNGNPVFRDDNARMVHPDEVMAPSSPGPIFILVDCPTRDHIPCLLQARGLKDFHQGGAQPHKSVSCMVHIGPSAVTSDSLYQQWMALFPETNHILAGHGSQNLNSPILKGSARVMVKLNYICPRIFPYCGLQAEDELDSAQGGQIAPPNVHFCKAENLLKFRLRPLSAMGLDRASIPDSFSSTHVRNKLVEDIPEIENVRDRVALLWNGESKVKAVRAPQVSEAPVAPSRYPVEEPWLEASCHTTQNSSLSSGLESIEKTENSVLPNVLSSMEADSEVLPECLHNVHREEMEIVFLGTGSSQPSKYRNVSAIFLNLFSRGGVLLDCGEGTYGQLKRRYGLEGADAVVAGLKCVWISHIHADHHTGLSRILAVRKSLLRIQGNFSPILVIGPRQLKGYLDAYERLEDLGMVFLDCSQTTAGAHAEAMYVAKAEVSPGQGSPDRKEASSRGLIRPSSVGTDARSSRESGLGNPRVSQMQNYWVQAGYDAASRDEAAQRNFKRVLASLGLKSLVSVPVIHCPEAYGVIVESEGKVDGGGVMRAGWKLAYSGDTRPSRNLLDACFGATVLIHEATFDDGMIDEAKAKRHSITREAIATGRQGKVFRTILTHFSQRYPKIPVFDESYTDKTCIAFDMMSVNLADLHLCPRLLSALKLLFRDDLIGAEEAADVGEVVEY